MGEAPEGNQEITQRHAVRAGTVATAGLLASQAISFLGVIVLARLAPPQTFGAYAAASILLGVSQIFSESGMRAAVIQRDDRVEEAASTAFIANIVGGVCLAVLAAACAPLIGLFFHSREIAAAAAVLAGTIPINAAAIVPGALLQRRVSFRFPFVGPFGSLSYVIAAIVALSNGLGLWGLVLATYAAAAASTTVVFALARWRPVRGLVSLEMWRSLAQYGRPVLLSLFLREVGFSGTTAVVGRLLGTADLGRFRFAQRVALQVNSAVVYGSAYVLFPTFSRVWRDESRFRNYVLRALRALTLIAFPLSLAFIPLGEPFATVVLGDTWRGTGSILMAMSGVGVALALDSISSEVFKATGRTDLLPRMHALTASVPLLLMLGLQGFGAAGMGVALSVGMLVVSGYAIHGLSGVTGMPIRLILLQIRPALLSASTMAAGVFLLDRETIHAGQHSGLLGVALLLIDVILAAILYLVSLRLLSKHALFELKDLATLLVRRTNGSASTAAQ